MSFHQLRTAFLKDRSALNPFGPENVTSGVAKPEKWTNIWISDPSSGFPQHLILDFGERVIKVEGNYHRRRVTALAP
jgi:hypothetical protein